MHPCRHAIEGSSFNGRALLEFASLRIGSNSALPEGTLMDSVVSKVVVSGKTRESLLVLSDVHLGSDLNTQALTTGFGRRSKRVDDDLVKLLEHYRAQRPAGERWRVVIAGDFIDFIGMAIPPGENELETVLDAEEREHGVGNSEDHARLKLRRVLARHENVFRALAGFLTDGHAITIVHGNHDVELYWESVRSDLSTKLVALAAELSSSASVPQVDVESRIEFCPWFFYQHGVAYIEHGHMYDPLCATESIMAPLSPLDPRRVARGFCEVFLRYVVRPTRGMPEHGHEHTGIFDYLRMGMRLGLSGMLTLGLRFLLAIIELIRVQRGFLTDAARALKVENEKRISELALKTLLGIDRLKELASLQVPPVTRTVWGILASVLIDRLAVAFAAFASLSVFVPLAIHRHGGGSMLAIVITLAAWLGAHSYLSARRKIDPAMDMAERAGKLARLFPAAFVVMGHTHVPQRQPIDEGRATYINLGSWDEDEVTEQDAVPYEAARTHLVIHPPATETSAPEAEFLKWDSIDGPRKFSV
jgi:UDP-2,3-diacylglucosamine pyrophosphatase LpxH